MRCLLHGNGAGLATRATECSHPSSCATLASPLALSGQSYHRPSGIAVTPQQPIPDAAAAPLKGQQHGAVPEQVIVDPRASHE